eukprot:CAMPEP_0176079042 /NCGR_PEP_ID=MMETSP0120_2-20121206/39531_1 /TAXON_ID=160619 /ORGANISM="Kryptoperidinium foliaceum, Strain CCMP 1326" /LENGTH=81 /DNA_ID=CAMNT_0017412795 /DNA_START=251 /DNA_END=496 /DNA_ORIENTATION=+
MAVVRGDSQRRSFQVSNGRMALCPTGLAGGNGAAAAASCGEASGACGIAAVCVAAAARSSRAKSNTHAAADRRGIASSRVR